MITKAPCVPCPHLATLGPLAVATKAALHEIKVTAAKLGVAPLYRLPAGLVLTEREMQVLEGVAAGKQDAEIGVDLAITGNTVKTHVHRLMSKLAARNRAQAVHMAWQYGWFGPARDEPS